jgi:hypothetical protein
MRKLLTVIVVALFVALAGVYFNAQDAGPSGGGENLRSNDASGLTAAGDSDAVLARAYREHRSSIQVRGAGTVTRVLADDNDGDRHQRFILELTSGQTLLIAHNIDLAPRIPKLRIGDRVGFYGEYEWNDQGGVIHWTHRDPAGRHLAGWLEHAGTRYD